MEGVGVVAIGVVVVGASGQRLAHHVTGAGTDIRWRSRLRRKSRPSTTAAVVTSLLHSSYRKELDQEVSKKFGQSRKSLSSEAEKEKIYCSSYKVYKNEQLFTTPLFALFSDRDSTE